MLTIFLLILDSKKLRAKYHFNQGGKTKKLLGTLVPLIFEGRMEKISRVPVIL